MVGREYVEWLNFWFDKANEKRNDRILLIGDSIARDYRGPLASLTNLPVDFFATTAAMDDKMFWKTLDLFLEYEDYRWQKAHIQIGVHSIDGMFWAKRNVDLLEYEKTYERLVCTIREIVPDLTIATTTKVVNSKDLSSIDAYVTEEIKKRNEIAVRIAEKYGLPVNDLFKKMYNWPHRDKVHFTLEGRNQMAEYVAAAMKLT